VPRASIARKRSSNDAIDPERPNAQTTKQTLTAREDVPALCAQTRIVAIARSRYTDCCWLVPFLLDRAILSPHCRIQGLMGRPKLGDPMNTTCGACGVPISKFRVLVSKCNVIFNRDARYLRCPSCRAAELHCAPVGVTGRPERILHVCTREDAWVAASKRLDTFTSGVSQVTFNANVQSAATLSRHGTEDALAGRGRTLGEVCSWPISEIDELPRLSLRSQLGCSAHASLTVPRTEYLALRAEYFELRA